MYVYDPVGDRCIINFDKVMRKIEIPYPKPRKYECFVLFLMRLLLLRKDFDKVRILING